MCTECVKNKDKISIIYRSHSQAISDFAKETGPCSRRWWQNIREVKHPNINGANV